MIRNGGCLMDENIDVSEWLPKSFAETYPHRIARGDLAVIDGNLKSSETIWPIDILLDRGVITGAQHRTAMFIIMTRLAIAKSLGLDRVMRQMRMTYDEPMQVHSASPSYFLNRALHGLTALESLAMERATTMPAGSYKPSSHTSDAAIWLGRFILSLRDALDKVQKNIDRQLDICKNDITQDARSVSTDCRA